MRPRWRRLAGAAHDIRAMAELRASGRIRVRARSVAIGAEPLRQAGTVLQRGADIDAAMRTEIGLVARRGGSFPRPSALVDRIALAGEGGQRVTDLEGRVYPVPRSCSCIEIVVASRCSVRSLLYSVSSLSLTSL